MMIGIDKSSSNRLKQTNTKPKILYTKDVLSPSLIEGKFIQKSSSSINSKNIPSPQYSESFISNSNLSRTEADLSKQSNISSNDHPDSSSSIENISAEFRQRTQLTNLLSLDLVQSSANLIYPNPRTISSGYVPDRTKHHSIYVFENKRSSSKNMPLVFLGSEYFFRKSTDFSRLKFPLSTSENVEPLVDLFLIRPQFRREIPGLNDLSTYLFLPQTISALLFFDSSSNQCARHLCHELRTKENKNKFTIKDLLHMSQRENNIIQINAVNDRRYHALKNQLTEIYYYENSSSSSSTKQKQTTLSLLDKMTRTISPISRPSIPKHSRIKTRSSMRTSILS